MDSFEGVSDDISLCIGASNIPDAGYGLFTNLDIPFGTKLGYYLGDLFDNANDLSYEELIYSYQRSDKLIIIPYPDCPFRYINDTVDVIASIDHREIVHLPLRYNIDWYESPDGFVQIRSICDIQAGEELYINYDTLYWEARLLDG
jgi:hypothetical protein